MRHGDMVKTDKITDKMPLTKAAQSSPRQRKLSTATATPGKRAAPPDIGHYAASGEAASAKKLQKEGAARMRGGDDDNGGGEARAGMPAGAGDHGPVADEPGAWPWATCGIGNCAASAKKLQTTARAGDATEAARRRGGERSRMRQSWLQRLRGGHGHEHDGQHDHTRARDRRVISLCISL